jgi:hypothetical protein
MLTDCVFWFIIFPCLTVKDYNLNFVSARVSCLPQQGISHSHKKKKS